MLCMCLQACTKSMCVCARVWFLFSGYVIFVQKPLKFAHFYKIAIVFMVGLGINVSVDLVYLCV